VKRFPPVYSDQESAILLAMYEVANGTYTSYTLAKVLNPTVETSTPAAEAAFLKTRDATEQLIVRGLVGGERLKGADGVYFNKLKLTTKGQQAAIQQRETVERTKKAMAEVTERAQYLVAEMKRSEDTKK
jgi:hypothetical protein